MRRPYPNKRTLRLRSGGGRGMFKERKVRVRGPEGAERERGGPTPAGWDL